jgi:hypothetical protein
LARAATERAFERGESDGVAREVTDEACENTSAEEVGEEASAEEAVEEEVVAEGAPAE